MAYVWRKTSIAVGSDLVDQNLLSIRDALKKLPQDLDVLTKTEQYAVNHAIIAALDGYVVFPALPAGSVQLYAGSSIPTGWLLCNGSAVSRTTYATLFTAIGTTWGTGDGSTTFNLPDSQGRVAMGAGSGSGLTTRTLGSKTGVETVALSTANLPAHNHGVTDPGHQHTALGHILLPNGSTAAWTATSTSLGGGNENTNSATTGITTQNTGSGTAHNNIQPSAVFNFIIYTGL